MSRGGGGSTSLGENFMPRDIERLWLVGKFAVLGTLVVSALLLFTPVLFFLLVFIVPVCFPLGCGITALLYIKKNNLSRPLPRRGDVCECVSPDSISPSRSQSALSDTTTEDADRSVQPRSRESSLAESREQVERAVTSAKDQPSTQQETKGASIQNTGRKPGKTGVGAVEGADTAEQGGYSLSGATQRQSKASQSAAENNIRGQATSDKKLDFASSSEEHRASEYGHPTAKDSHSQNHVQDAKDDVPRAGKKQSRHRRKHPKS